MSERIDEIRERLDKATPGPWKATYEAADDWVSITGQGFYDGGHWMTCPEVATCEGIVGPDADLIANAPADLAWLLGEVERLSAERMQPEQPEPTAAEVLAAAEESEHHEQWGYDENGFPHCECGASLVESEHDLSVVPSLMAHQARAALLAARKVARHE